MSDDNKVVAPNGKTYTFHPNGGYVYALGHRVYGRKLTPVWNSSTQNFDHPFRPGGKWAFILNPNIAAVQPEQETAQV